MAIDQFGRKIHYLRISLTDHCNLRCIYCMPEDQTFRPNPELMQDDEIALLTRLFASLGFDKIRLTGGEPTVRNHIVEIVRSIASTEGIRAVSMTTNGVLLKKLAQPLAEAGLKRVNVSIDTLDADKFQRLTRWGKLDDVWQGILAAEQAGLHPVKLNAVVVKGYNEADVVDLARLTIDHPWQMRFIEMMPFAGVTDVQTGQVITAAQIQERIEAAVGSPRAIQRWRAGRRSAPLSHPGRAGRCGLHFVGDRAVLRVLQPCPADGGRTPAPVPAARERGGPADASARGRLAGGPAALDPGWNLAQAVGARTGGGRDPVEPGDESRSGGDPDGYVVARGALRREAISAGCDRTASEIATSGRPLRSSQ